MSSSAQRKVARVEASNEKENVRPYGVSTKPNVKIQDKDTGVRRKPLTESTIRVESRHASLKSEQVRVLPTPTSTTVLRRYPVSERKPVTKGVTPPISRTISSGASSAISNRRLVPSAPLKKSSGERLSTVPPRQSYRPLPTSSTTKDVRVKVSSVAPKKRIKPASAVKQETNNVVPVAAPKQRSTSVSSIKQTLTGRTLGVPKQRSVSASPIKKDKDNVQLFEAPKQRSMSMTSLKKKLMSSAIFGSSHQRSDQSSSVGKKDSEHRPSNIPKLKQKWTSTSSLAQENENVTIRSTSKQRSNSTEGRFTDCYKPTVDRMWYSYLQKIKTTCAVRNVADVTKEYSIAGQCCSEQELPKRLLPANNQSRIMAMKNPIERLKREEAVNTVRTPVDGLPEPPIPMKVNLRRKIAARITQDVPTEFDFLGHYDDDLLAMEAERERRSHNLSENFLRRNINADQRRILVVFLIHVSSHCDYSTSVIYQAVKLLDVVVDRITVDTVNLQLVALAVLWITLKREERLSKIPSATSIIALAGGLYQGRQDLLVNCEQKILMALDFNISFADPMSIFVYFVQNCKQKINFPDSSMPTIYYYGSYIVDVTLLELNFCRISPTILATVAAELVLCLILELEQNLSHPFWAFWKNMIFSELDEPNWYDNAEMKVLRVAIIRCILRSGDRHGGSEVVYKKYRRSKYGRIADRLIQKAKLLYWGLMQ